MQFNVFKPGKSVQNCIDNPNMKLAFFLVLLPTLATAIGFFLYGFPFRLDKMLVSFVRSILTWLLLSIAAFIILYLARGKAMQSKFSGTASALSLLWIINLVLAIVGMVFFPLVLSPQIIQEAKFLATGQSTVEEFVSTAYAIIDANPSAVNLGIALVGVLTGAFLTLLSFYLMYALVRAFYQTRILKKLVVSLIILASWLFVSSWILVLI